MAENIHIMGIVNLTPDSFFEGSRVQGADATARIRQMWEEGARVADLGACSTRPGSPQPSLEEEWRRLEPVLQDIAPYVTPGSISIDTYRAEIVRRAYGIIGPFLINDVSAGTLDPQMLSTVGQLGLPYVAMHMRGTPQTYPSIASRMELSVSIKNP